MATVPSGLQQAGAEEHLRALMRRWALALLVLGLAWRALRYLLRFPIWGDEAMLCLNFLELDYAGLTRRLHNCQVAPILFLWGELTALRLLGSGELAMRLLPFLASVGGLFLFWRLARLTLAPLGATLALGFLAVAIWPVSMGAFIKPYSFDLLMASVLLLPAAHWLHQPHQSAWLVLLTLLVPLAIFGSYPVVFVGGAISLALLPTAWRQPGARPKLLYAAYNAVLIGSFLANYYTIGKGQLSTPVGQGNTELGMQAYWAEGFPPATPLAFAKWFVLAHTGQMTAYPIGSQDGGSSLTALLCLAGAWHFWKARRRSLLVLCAAPFALGLLAAALHRYPYGASCRLTQYLAPAICLTAGAGAAALLERLRSAERRRRWVLGTCAFFLAVGLVGMGREVYKPYRCAETRWTAQVMRDFAAEARSGAPIVVLNRPEEIDALFRWHLGLYGERVSWNGQIDWDRAAACGEVVCVRHRCTMLKAKAELPAAPARSPGVVPAELEARMLQGRGNWALKAAVTDSGAPESWQDPVQHLDRFRWVLERPARNVARQPTPRTRP
jgi:hypothetical protein